MPSTSITVNDREPGTSTIFVMPSAGGDRSHWTQLTAPPKWADKPRWSPDGKMVYFLSGIRSSTSGQCSSTALPDGRSARRSK